MSCAIRLPFRTASGVTCSCVQASPPCGHHLDTIFWGQNDLHNYRRPMQVSLQTIPRKWLLHTCVVRNQQNYKLLTPANQPAVNCAHVAGKQGGQVDDMISNLMLLIGEISRAGANFCGQWLVLFSRSGSRWLFSGSEWLAVALRGFSMLEWLGTSFF